MEYANSSFRLQAEPDQYILFADGGLYGQPGYTTYGGSYTKRHVEQLWQDANE